MDCRTLCPNEGDFCVSCDFGEDFAAICDSWVYVFDAVVTATISFRDFCSSLGELVGLLLICQTMRWLSWS